MPKFVETYFVVVAHHDLTLDEKLSMRWGIQRGFFKAFSNYAFTFQYLRNNVTKEVHTSPYKAYRYSSLNNEAMKSHVIPSMKCMKMPQLIRIVEGTDIPKVHIRWCVLSVSEHTLEPTQSLLKAVAALLGKVLERKNWPVNLPQEALDFIDGHQ